MALRPHTLVASMMASTPEEAVAAFARLPAEVGLAEVRLDALWPSVPDADAATDALLDLVDAAPLPLLATLRPVRQGGRFDGPEHVRLGLLQAALRAGFAYADLEMDGLDAAARVSQLRPDGDVVASQHLAETPCRSDGLTALLAMQDLPVSLDKLAFPAGAFPDLLRAFELARTHALRGGRPAVSPFGYGGAAARALLPLLGNRATYGSAPGLPAAAPGQPGADDVAAVWRHWGLTADDLDACASKPGPWMAVLGTPIAHSLSPRIHNAALRAAGRPERYGALDVPASSSALRLVLHVAPRLGLAAASVTAPHKQDAARIAAGDDAVQRTGAANALRLRGETYEATNTDVTALTRLLRPGVDAGASAVVLGAGGAARAAVAALQDLGASVRVAARDPARLAVTVKDLGAEAVAWDRRGETHADVWVQATQLGAVASDPSPATPHGARLAVDLVYAAGETAFQREARQAGANVVDGRQVLLAQAQDAYRFWFGQEPDAAAMRGAL
jgi:shikimate dehydrogenase/3-dehydroquinate dehydratase type I